MECENGNETARTRQIWHSEIGKVSSLQWSIVVFYLFSQPHVYVYAYLCIDCGSQYQCFSVWTVSCMRMCFRVHMYAYTYVCRKTPTRVHMYTHTRTYINVYAYIYTDIHMYMYIHIHMHLYTHTCTHIYIRMHMHTYAQIENLSNNASTRQAVS